jgi:very-short-patch-repair endonuclease
MTERLARKLRRNMTESESRLWLALRNRQLDGLKFRRQQPIGSYIVDFVCHEAQLVVEVDGGQHAEADEAIRSTRIESDGYRILRFWNHDVLGPRRSPLTLPLCGPLPLPQGERGKGRPDNVRNQATLLKKQKDNEPRKF